MRPIFFAFYFGFGIMTNLFMFGAINWSNWAAWAVILMWPALWFCIMFFTGLVIYLIALFLIWVADNIGRIPLVRSWNKRRMDKRIRKFLRVARAPAY